MYICVCVPVGSYYVKKDYGMMLAIIFLCTKNLVYKLEDGSEGIYICNTTIN